MADIVRIAMWSGPRNISTAMMRSFENRTDTAVYDEPFYAAYLRLTGTDHPMRDAVIAAGEAEWQRVVDTLFAPLPAGVTVHYQKHMSHHMLPEIDRGWIDRMRNGFLIRRPENVLASYVKKREAVTLDDIGFVQLGELFDRLADRLGEAPPVVDARDVADDPEAILPELCRRLGISFSPRMLNWPAGLRASDGVWAVHWYHAVAASTRFQKLPEEDVNLPPHLARIADAAQPVYERLKKYRIRAK